jgi:hypothetical protein
MKHFAPAEFWQAYQRLPKSVQKLADKNFKLLKQHPSHPSLALKKIGRLRSVRVGLHDRALAVKVASKSPTI